MNKVLLGGLLLAGACSSMADESYNGEPLLELHGTVSNALTAATAAGNVAVAVVWEPGCAAAAPGEQCGSLDLGAPRYRVGQLAEVVGDFPATFQLTLHEPPPDAALQTLTGSDYQFAVGKIVAVDKSLLVDRGNGVIDATNAIIGSTDEAMQDPLVAQDHRIGSELHVWYNATPAPDEHQQPGAEAQVGFHLQRTAGLEIMCDFLENDRNPEGATAEETCRNWLSPNVTAGIPQLPEAEIAALCAPPHSVCKGELKAKALASIESGLTETITNEQIAADCALPSETGVAAEGVFSDAVIPTDTALHITIGGAMTPTYFTPLLGGGGIYPASQLPTCN